jgi:hypothetical protein
MSEPSSQSAELNSDHRDIDPSFGAGHSGFAITNQSALPHQPAKSSLYDPAAWQDLEASSIIGTFDDLDRQFGAKPLDPLGERLAGVAAIHPQDAEPSEPAQHAAQDHLRAETKPFASHTLAFVVVIPDAEMFFKVFPRIVGGSVDMGAYEMQNPGFTLPYLWAQQYGLSCDGSIDSDRTGMNNWQKWLAGLNPTNPASLFKISAVTPAKNPARVTVTWLSVSNRTYFVQRGSALAGQPQFSLLPSNLAGNVTATSFTDTNINSSGSYFYRVGVQQ